MTLLPLSLLLLVAALGATLRPADAAAQQRDRDAYHSWIDTTVVFTRGGAVDLLQLSGDVVVTGWDRDELRVRAYAEHGRVESSFSSGRVALRVEAAGADRRRGRVGESRIEVTVPTGARVRAGSLSGNVRVTGTGGEVEASSSSGNVTVSGTGGLTTVKSFSGNVSATNVDGDVSATTTSGDLTVRDVRGDARVVSLSGDVTLAGIGGRSVTARTTSGDVRFDGAPERNARYEFVSHSGDVTLLLPEDAGADMSVQTYSGTLDTDFPVTIGGTVASRPRALEFTVGGGGARIRAETFSGDVVLRRAGDERDRRGARERR